MKGLTESRKEDRHRIWGKNGNGRSSTVGPSLPSLTKKRQRMTWRNCCTRRQPVRHTLLMHLIDWGEIYYNKLQRRGGEVRPQNRSPADIGQMPINIVESTNFDLIRQAATFKLRKLSYADCFAAALALNCGDVNLSPETANLNRSKTEIRLDGPLAMKTTPNRFTFYRRLPERLTR